MKILVFCPRGSRSADSLVGWLSRHGGPTLRVGSREQLPRALEWRPSLLISWGNPLRVGTPPELTTLNSRAPIGNKFVELGRLAMAGVPTPRTSTTPVPGWLARARSHHDGSDLAVPPRNPNYYVEPVVTTHEFRINVFLNRPFRTGVKIPMPPEALAAIGRAHPHPFIRTKPFGWTWSYSQERLDHTGVDRRPLREAAVRAVVALGYDFGAVDVGRRPDGTPVVFEVNSAPSLEGSDLSRWGQLFLDVVNRRNPC